MVFLVPSRGDWELWLACCGDMLNIDGTGSLYHVNPWPVHSCTGQLFHPLHPEMTQMQEFKDLRLKARRNDDSGAI